MSIYPDGMASYALTPHSLISRFSAPCFSETTQAYPSAAQKASVHPRTAYTNND